MLMARFHNIFSNFPIVLKSEKHLSDLILIELDITNFLTLKMYPEIMDKPSCI